MNSSGNLFEVAINHTLSSPWDLIPLKGSSRGSCPTSMAVSQRRTTGSQTSPGLFPFIIFMWESYPFSFCSSFPIANLEAAASLSLPLTLAVLSFLMALGSNTSVYEFIVMLPGFDKIRAPAKILVLWVLAMALLAGKGMDGLFSRSNASLRRRLGVAFVSILAILALDAALHVERALILKLFSPFFLDNAIPGRMGFAESLIRSEWHRFTLLSSIIFLITISWVRGLLKAPLAASLLCGLLFLDLAYVNRGAARHQDKIYAEAARVKEQLGAALGEDKTVFRVGSFRSKLGS